MDTDPAPPVMPCQEPPRASTSYPSVAIFAIRSATSVASDPVLTKIVRFSPPGSQSCASVCASSATTSGIIPLKKWNAFSPARCTASTMAGWLCPMVAHIWPEVKSRYSRPFASVTMVPLAERNSVGNASPP